MKTKTLGVVLFIFVLLGVALAAENDPVNKLIGRWEGLASTKQNPRRRLVVESVNRDGDQWVGSGTFGNADQEVNTKVDIKITVNGNDIALEFLNSQNNPVQLRLADDNDLAGTIRVPAGRSLVDAQMNLKKVQ